MKVFRRRDATGHTGYQCSDCGTWHEQFPMSFHSAAPAPWSPDLDGAEDCELTSDACVIRGEHFFVRGLVRVPVIDHDDHFEWGVWVSLSEANFWRMTDAWETPGREQTPPMFGWLCTSLPTYAVTTLSLRTQVHTQPVGSRPRIELERTDHPLAVEQRDGITYDAVARRAAQLLRQT